MANRLDGKGSARKVKLYKRAEAEDRNARTPDSKRRSYWRSLGFKRQSHAERLVLNTVTDVNERAKIHKQRSEDWPILPEEISAVL